MALTLSTPREVFVNSVLEATKSGDSDADIISPFLSTPDLFVDNFLSSTEAGHLIPCYKVPCFEGRRRYEENTGKTLTSFDEFFNKLPLELRQKIWEEHIEPDEPGIVVILVTPTRYKKAPFDIRPLQPIPTILQVSSEARQEGKRFYKLFFGEGAWHPARTYVKVNRQTGKFIDTICIRYPPMPRGLTRTRALRRLETTTFGAFQAIGLYDYNISRLGVFMYHGERHQGLVMACQGTLCSLMAHAVPAVDLIIGDPATGSAACLAMVDAEDPDDLIGQYNFMLNYAKLPHRNAWNHGVFNHALALNQSNDGNPEFFVKRMIRGEQKQNKWKKFRDAAKDSAGDVWDTLWNGLLDF